MKYKFQILMILLLICLNLVACKKDDETQLPSDASEADIVMNINFDVSKANLEISENIYGTFIEHIEKCIYNGIWSEIILDRKFVAPIGEDVSQWQIKGEVVTNTTDTLGDDYSCELHEGAAISQRGIALDKDKSYAGYLYAKGKGKLKLTYQYEDIDYVIDLDVDNDDFNKLTYEFNSTLKNRKYKLTIEATEGNVIIDSLSLMPSDNIYGMRKDTLDILKKLNAPFYRWPGGNFVSGYDWEDGIGNRDYRKTQRNLEYLGELTDFANDDERLANDLVKIGSLGFYGAFEPNDYGLDEFIKMCQYLNAEPNIVVNAGYGNAQQAANEVAYCNTINTTYGNMRPSSEPYKVKYFSIGNEMNGDWQLGHVGINEYIKRHNEFYNAMKKVDSTIEIIGVGDNHSSWSNDMLANCEMDYISEHFYAERYETDSKEHINSIKKQAEYRIQKHRELNTNVMMCIDEYAYLNAEIDSRLKDGMGVALGLNTFIRNADVVKIACYSSTINATQGSLSTDDFNAYLEGNGYALMLYRENLYHRYLPISYRKSTINDYAFEIIGTYDEQLNQIAIAIVNASDQIVEIKNSNFKSVIERSYVTSNFLDDYDSADSMNFKQITDKPEYALVLPQSITILTIKL